MQYQESLDYLYGLQRFGIKLGLDNIRGLLDVLEHPERAFGVVHVAGTNGKGSVSACLAKILQQAGYRVGLYTSPHLHSFTERIRVNGIPIDEERVGSLTAEIREAADGIPATFFEFTTALALLYFKLQAVDFAILETGMGGRLDATNAVTPLLSLITPVSMDHVEHLGDTLPTIAAEKAGIIKAGVPVVVGRQEDAALQVILAQADRLGAPAWAAGRDYRLQVQGERFSLETDAVSLQDLEPGLSGAHQVDNLGQAVAGAIWLRSLGLDIPDAALCEGVRQVRWPGRLEWWGDEGVILLDGAHNGSGAKVLADYLAPQAAGRIRWVAGVKGGRKVSDILAALLPLVSAVYCASPSVEEAVPAEDLARAVAQSGVPSSAYTSPHLAMEAALKDWQPGEIVLVAGSLFLVAAIRDYLIQREGRKSVSSAI